MTEETPAKGIKNTGEGRKPRNQCITEAKGEAYFKKGIITVKQNESRKVSEFGSGKFIKLFRQVKQEES